MFENVAEEFESYQLYSLISPLLKAAFKPCKRRNKYRTAMKRRGEKSGERKNKTLWIEKETDRFNLFSAI